MPETFELVVDAQGNMAQGQPGGLVEVMNRINVLEQKVDANAALLNEIKATVDTLKSKLPGAKIG